ncbi:MAG: tRNA 2-thiouridine(34) synthase MnmA [Phototrophicaceae bacterium]
MSNAEKRVVVAMSGGVDSSVAAALLVEQGYEVIGMMMRLWSDEAMGGAEHNRCCTPEQMADARRIADHLGIPFYVLDTKDVFRATVVQFFIDAHRDGFTPNPCMECNRHIRFEYLQQNALALGADYLATGHYARIHQDDGLYTLKTGIDDNKDQSYVLSVMGQYELSHAMFPIGEYPKSEVRKLAAKYGLQVESKKDSQDLCFLGNNDYREFLQVHAPETMVSGPIVLANGEQIGTHEGLVNYTIGQRKGLGLNSNTPLYVIAKNPYRNALIVGTRDQLGHDELIAGRVNWVSDQAPTAPFRAQVKIRYKSDAQPALVTPIGSDRFAVKFDEPLRDITPGQGAVIYDGAQCLGGGQIEKADETIATLSTP